MKAVSGAPSSLENCEFDVFISAARSDNATGMVTAVVEVLQAWFVEQRQGTLRTFWDPNPCSSIEDWTERLLPQMKRSRLMLCFLSPDYFACPYCEAEWKAWKKIEVARRTKSRGIIPAYVVTYPPLTSQFWDLSRHFLNDLKPRPVIDVRQDWGGGTRGLQYPEVRETFGGVANAIVSRLEEFAVARGYEADVPCPPAAEIPARLEQLPMEARWLLSYAVMFPPTEVFLAWLRPLVAYHSDELRKRHRKGVPDPWQRVVARLRKEGLLVRGKKKDDRVVVPAPVREAVLAQLPPPHRARLHAAIGMLLLQRAQIFPEGYERTIKDRELAPLTDFAIEACDAGDPLGASVGKFLWPRLEDRYKFEDLKQVCDHAIPLLTRAWEHMPENPLYANDLAKTHFQRAQVARKLKDEHGEMRHLLRCRETLERIRQEGLTLDEESQRLWHELNSLIPRE